jgi:hypothetical protein
MRSYAALALIGAVRGLTPPKNGAKVSPTVEKSLFSLPNALECYTVTRRISPS